MTRSFADGEPVEADAVIGADGVHSIVRDIIIGPDAPIHKGRIAYRAVFPSSLMGGTDVGQSGTKWWGPDPTGTSSSTTRGATAARSTS